VDPAEPDVPIVRLAGADGPEETAVDMRGELAP